MILRLGHVTAVLVTGSTGPAATHIPLGSEAGLTEYDESYANASDIHTIPQPSLHKRRGRLDPTELESVAEAVRISLGL